jgi:DNA-binding transcriptional LysR family regulator
MDLEQEVGVQRRNRTCFLAGALQTLKHAKQTLETTQQTSRGCQGVLRIANIGLLCPTLLATLIRSFRERFPKVQILLLQQNGVEEVETVLERAHLGIGFLTCRRLEAFESRVIATASVGVIAAGSIMQGVRVLPSSEILPSSPFLEFWPDFKGRDGSRTPMPWSSESPHGGFSDAKPWFGVPV